MHIYTDSHKHAERILCVCTYHELLLSALVPLVRVSEPALCCCCCCSSARCAGLFSRTWTTSKCFLLLMFGCCLIITRSPTRHLSSESWQRYFRCLLMYCKSEGTGTKGGRGRGGRIEGGINRERGRRKFVYVLRIYLYSAEVHLLYCKA